MKSFTFSCKTVSSLLVHGLEETCDWWPMVTPLSSSDDEEMGSYGGGGAANLVGALSIGTPPETPRIFLFRTMFAGK